MNKLLYLPESNRCCGDCGCTKAVPEAVVRRRPEFVFIPTRACETCGDAVEVDVAPLTGGPKASYIPACDDCGSTDALVKAEINLPDGMGEGWIRICATCIARYDEGHAAWAQ